MMSSQGVRRWRLGWTGLALAAGAVALLGAGLDAAGAQAAKPAAAAKYIGSAKCKNCHSSKESGDQYGKWKEVKHSSAFARLSAPEALETAKAKGVADPAKAPECVKCHTTAASEPDDRVAKGFDRKEGVGCESCHGPGEKHMKARMAAAAAAEDGADAAKAPRQEVGKDEIIKRPEPATCLGCHNKESPSYKPFCFKHRMAEIAHFDPRDTKAKEQFDADVAKMECTCKPQN